MGVVYCIEHDSGKKYIGSTTNKSKRWSEHRRSLDNDSHSNPCLQNAWNKYGASAFKFYVIENNIDNDVLLDREVYWTKYYSVLDRRFGYNIINELGGGSRRFSADTIQKMSESHKDKHHSEETKQKMSVTRQGKPLSEATRQRISEANKGKSPSKETKQKQREAQLGKKNHNFGKPKSEATKQRMSEAQLGEKGHNYGKTTSESTKKKQREASNGENNPRSILIEALVIEIIELQKQGVSVVEIARRYNVSKMTIYSIKYKTTWRHIPR